MVVFRQIVDREPEHMHAPPRNIEERPKVVHVLTGEDISVMAATERCDNAYLAWCKVWNAYSPESVCRELWAAYTTAFEDAQRTAHDMWGLATYKET